MKRWTIPAVGLLTALLGIGCGGKTNLRITLRLTDTTRSASRLRGDSARVQTRLDWLYEEPGFRPPSQRAKVEIGENRLVVTVQDTVGAARIERLVSTPGLVTFRLIAEDSVAADILDTTDGWLRKHPVAGVESLVGRIGYRRGGLRVAVRDYPLVSAALAGVDTMVYGDWRPVFGAADMGNVDTLRTLYFVERQPQLSNAMGWLIEHADAHRPRGARPSRLLPKDAEPFRAPFVVNIQLSRDTLGGNPTRKLSEITAEHVRRRLAIVLDSVVLSAPMIQSEIPDGSCMVVTDDTLGAYARDLANVLSHGRLFGPLVVEGVERTRAR